MSMIPSSIGRVPNLLSSRIALGNITRTNVSLLRVQEQLATGRLINRTSDDSIRSATVMELNNRSQRSVQRQRNIDHGTAALDPRQVFGRSERPGAGGEANAAG